MTATRILSGLERSPAKGSEADVAARMGFLEWAFSLDGAATPDAARAALDSPAAQHADSAAARAFVGFLEQAAIAVPMIRPRRKGRRVLH